MRQVVVLLGVLLAVAVMAAPAALAGNKTGQTCNKGKYVNYIDPSTGRPFAAEDVCTSFLAENGVLYPLSTAICFDASWSLIEDLNNGADGSATSGIPCANFVLGGGSLAGLRVTTTGTSISFSFSLDAFAVNHVATASGIHTCSIVLGRRVCSTGIGRSARDIASPYTYAASGSFDCTLVGSEVSKDESATWTFTTLGGYSLVASLSCSNAQG
jgi:hypothetical protein